MLQQSLPRILCMGHDLALLNSRCAVLERSGYHAEPTTLKNGIATLQGSAAFDLVVLPYKLNDQVKQSILSALPETTCVYQIDHFTGPQHLLCIVGRLICEAPGHRRTRRRMPS